MCVRKTENVMIYPNFLSSCVFFSHVAPRLRTPPKVMSFATVVPYTFIVDGPRAIRWWSSFAEESAVATEASAGNGSRGFGELEDVASVPDGSALIFYLAASGVLLFLHSAVRDLWRKLEKKPWYEK